jgi:hypothetical protein
MRLGCEITPNTPLQRTRAGCTGAANSSAFGGRRLPLNGRPLGSAKRLARLLAAGTSLISTSAFAVALDLGQSLPKSAVKLNELLMVNPAQLVQVYAVQESGEAFKIGWQKDKGVTYIQPERSGFETPERVRAGMSFRDVRAVTQRDPEKYAGYLFAVRLPSGWFAGFVQGSSLTDGELQNDTKVVVVFKSLWLSPR